MVIFVEPTSNAEVGNWHSVICPSGAWLFILNLLSSLKLKNSVLPCE